MSKWKVTDVFSTHSLTKRLTPGTLHLTEDIFFSTHSLTKRLTAGSAYTGSYDTFQLTASRRGWPVVKQTLENIREIFNSQPHEEADVVRRCCFLWILVFSTHSLTKRLTTIRGTVISFAIFFNSQPHEEADKLQKQAMKTSDFSTHSLTKRLT